MRVASLLCVVIVGALMHSAFAAECSTLTTCGTCSADVACAWYYTPFSAKDSGVCNKKVLDFDQQAAAGLLSKVKAKDCDALPSKAARCSSWSNVFKFVCNKVIKDRMTELRGLARTLAQLSDQAYETKAGPHLDVLRNGAVTTKSTWINWARAAFPNEPRLQGVTDVINTVCVVAPNGDSMGVGMSQIINRADTSLQVGFEGFIYPAIDLIWAIFFPHSPKFTLMHESTHTVDPIYSPNEASFKIFSPWRDAIQAVWNRKGKEIFADFIGVNVFASQNPTEEAMLQSMASFCLETADAEYPSAETRIALLAKFAAVTKLVCDTMPGDTPADVYFDAAAKGAPKVVLVGGAVPQTTSSSSSSSSSSGSGSASTTSALTKSGSLKNLKELNELIKSSSSIMANPVVAADEKPGSTSSGSTSVSKSASTSASAGLLQTNGKGKK